MMPDERPEIVVPSPSVIARQVVDALVEDHDARWWSGRALTLAREVLVLNGVDPESDELSSLDRPAKGLSVVQAAADVSRTSGFSLQLCTQLLLQTTDLWTAQATAESRIAAALKAHWSDSDGIGATICGGCGHHWPCTTVRALASSGVA